MSETGVFMGVKSNDIDSESAEYKNKPRGYTVQIDYTAAKCQHDLLKLIKEAKNSKFNMLTGADEKNAPPKGEPIYKNNGQFFQMKLKSKVQLSSKSKTNSQIKSSSKQYPYPM